MLTHSIGRKLVVSALVASVLLMVGFRHDKNMHIVGGFVTGAAVLVVTKSGRAACAAALGVGSVKEIYDSTGKGNVEIMDLLATAAAPCLAVPF